jgi:sialate O-acetylesterase
MTIAGKNRIVLNNVLVGEVWVASGQSNMEWSVSAADNAQAEIAAANDPLLRMFTVTKKVAAEPQRDVAGGRWEPANPQTAGRFSAVGYSFARALRRSLGVPVGVIHSSWGGTRAEAWTSRPILETLGTPAREFERTNENSPAFRQARERYERQRAAFQAAGSPAACLPIPASRRPRERGRTRPRTSAIGKRCPCRPPGTTCPTVNWKGGTGGSGSGATWTCLLVWPAVT